jgi:tetratricopeptide (TPR) repeat protein
MLLTYLYVMEKECKKAVLEFEDSLKVYSLESLNRLFGEPLDGDEQSNFEMSVINYSIALDQLNRVKKALEIIEEALALAPDSSSLQKRKKYLKKRLKKLSKKKRLLHILKRKEHSTLILLIKLSLFRARRYWKS